jgi:hypothetical protein
MLAGEQEHAVDVVPVLPSDTTATMPSCLQSSGTIHDLPALSRYLASSLRRSPSHHPFVLDGATSSLKSVYFDSTTSSADLEPALPQSTCLYKRRFLQGARQPAELGERPA